MQNSKKFILAGALAVLGVATSFSATAQMTGSPRSASETPGASWIPYTSYGYVGASVGRTNYELGGCVAFLSCDDETTGFKIYTGGRFSRYVGVELGYVNLGKVSRNGGDIKAQGVNLSLVGNIPLGNDFNIFGKVGGIYAWTETSTVVPSLPAGKENGLGISYGLGVQYDINKTFAVRADWDRYRLKYVGNREDANLYSVGMVFKF